MLETEGGQGLAGPSAEGSAGKGSRVGGRGRQEARGHHECLCPPTPCVESTSQGMVSGDDRPREWSPHEWHSCPRGGTQRAPRSLLLPHGGPSEEVVNRVGASIPDLHAPFLLSISQGPVVPRYTA